MASTLRTRFIKKYQAMSHEERSEICLHFNGQPFTWNPIYIEVYNYTSMAYDMLKQLNKEKKI